VIATAKTIAAFLNPSPSKAANHSGSDLETLIESEITPAGIILTSGNFTYRSMIEQTANLSEMPLIRLCSPMPLNQQVLGSSPSAPIIETLK
jgi:hypothetical protein